MALTPVRVNAMHASITAVFNNDLVYLIPVRGEAGGLATYNTPLRRPGSCALFNSILPLAQMHR